jgi:hypothetical protein
MAKIEMDILSHWRLAERMDNVERLGKEVMAWVEKRSAKEAKVGWRFTRGDARIKLKKLYPSIG